MNNNFVLYKNIKELSFELIKYLNNIPRSMMFIKGGIEESFILSIKLIRYYVVNMNDTYRIKIKYLKDLVVELSMIDYYLEFLYVNKMLGKNKYSDFCNKLEEIRKLTFGVINSEKK